MKIFNVILTFLFLEEIIKTDIEIISAIAVSFQQPPVRENKF